MISEFDDSSDRSYGDYRGIPVQYMPCTVPYRNVIARYCTSFIDLCHEHTLVLLTLRCDNESV